MGKEGKKDCCDCCCFRMWFYFTSAYNVLLCHCIVMRVLLDMIVHCIISFYLYFIMALETNTFRLKFGRFCDSPAVTARGARVVEFIAKPFAKFASEHVLPYDFSNSFFIFLISFSIMKFFLVLF